jgi:hypothetical protein
VRDELVGDLGQRDLGDVELVLGDQAEEQVEGARIDIEVDLEGLGRRAPGEDAARRQGVRCCGQAAPPRAMSSRASWR